MTEPAAAEGLYDVAVVGMAGRFPGAPDTATLWQNLCRGVESISFFDEDELLRAGVPRETIAAPGFVAARGVVTGADLFDAPLFGFSPREARLMDPQQRLFLECAWVALGDASCDPGRFSGLVGVYAGVSQSSYFLANVLADPDLLRSVSPLEIRLANDRDFLATLTSYRLNLRGPSVTVATACSSSLVAVHLACQALLNRETDVALAGGAALSFPQVQGYLHEQGGILSADGHCRAFDAAASGSVGGDGVGLVVLKRLADALADRDSIRAVIKGSAIANDGAGKIGFTAPSVEGQAATIAQAQSAAGIAADSVTYVEAHGSGTPLGDPVEIRALTRAFRAGAADPERRGYCAVGSVKTNLGHLDAAAGIAGLIKTVLALEHRVIPPSLHFRQPNPAIPFAETPFFVAAEARPWESGDGPRRAGVNSFGIGGTNAHVVLEEAPAPLASGPSRPWQLLLLSAAGEGALERATDGLAAHLAAHPQASLADVAHSGRIGRPQLRCRRALVCRDREEAVEALAASAAMAAMAAMAPLAEVAALGERDASRLLSASDAVAGRPVAFLLPGVGDHYPGMASGLYETEEVFRREVDRAAELLAPLLGADVRTALFGGARFPAAGNAVGIARYPAAGTAADMALSPAAGAAVDNARSPAAGNAVGMARYPAAGTAADNARSPAAGTAVDMARYSTMATAGYVVQPPEAGDVVPPSAGHGGLDLRRMVRPRAGGPEAAVGAAEPAGGARAAGFGGADGLDHTLLAQPAVFVVDYALARLWESWGVCPHALLGYSLGEYVGACLAGVLSLADALRVVAWRARKIAELPPGAMLAVALPEAALAAMAGLHGDVGDVGDVGEFGDGGGLWLAAVNAPEQTVVSGTPEAVAALARRLGERGVACRRLPATHAFHSGMLQPLAAPFARFLAGIELRPPRIPYVTNVTGTWVTERQATDPEHWARHMVQPVRFAAGLAALWQEEPAACLLEVGPGHGLTTLARQQGPESGESSGPGEPGGLGGLGRVILPSLRPLYDPRPDGAFLLDTVAKLWLAGVEIDWAAFAAGERRNRVPLPAYPFERRRHWIEPRVSLAALLGVGEVVAVAGPAASPAAASAAGPACPPAAVSAGAGGAASAGTGDVASAGAGAMASAGTGDAASAVAGATASAGAGDAASSGAGDAASAGAGDAASAPFSPAGAAAAHPRPPLRTPFVAPRSPREERVAAIFQQLLRIDAVGVHDSFFELGGNSLLAPQVLLRLRLACGIDLPLPRLLAQPTVALVAQAVEELAAAPVDAAPGATAAAGAISAPAAATAATAGAAATAAATAATATAAPPGLAAEVVLDPAIRGAAEGSAPPSARPADPEAVLLTGATGFLGAFLLRDLLEQTRARVVCLVRAASPEAALARILANLERHRLALPAGAAARIVPLPGDLEAPRWNLSEAAFVAVAAEVEAVYHAAAWVNFTYPYAALKPANVTGTEEALRLAATGRRKPLHFISTIAVFPPAALADGVGREDADLSNPAGLAGGYPESKWVAERLVELAWRRGVPVTIHRPGLIGGDSRTGIGNPRDLLWAFLKSCLQLGAAPELASHFDPAPVDFVSRSIVHLSRQPRSLGRAFHHVHPRPLPWRELFDAAESLGYPVRRLSLEDWTPLLAAALDRSADNALAPFRSLFFGPAAAGGGDTDTRSALAVIPRFAAGNTLAGLAGSPIEAPPLDRRLLEIYFARLIESSFLPPPPAPAPPPLAPPEGGGGAWQGAAARP